MVGSGSRLLAFVSHGFLAFGWLDFGDLVLLQVATLSIYASCNGPRPVLLVGTERKEGETILTWDLRFVFWYSLEKEGAIATSIIVLQFLRLFGNSF